MKNLSFEFDDHLQKQRVLILNDFLLIYQIGRRRYEGFLNAIYIFFRLAKLQLKHLT